jgi:RNA-directed DNA polymerase
MLGVPTVADRIAQTVVKLVLEPMLEPLFHRNSYGYRPGHSALDAVAMVRRRNWEYDWVIEFDIKGLFDNIDHNLLLRAVLKHCQIPWVLLYIERWLKAPMQDENGQRMERHCGTPQGGVVSPLLSNLFLHYAFDRWVTQNLRSEVLSLRRRWSSSLQKPATGANGIAKDWRAIPSVWVGASSGENADCLLQRHQSARVVSDD